MSSERAVPGSPGWDELAAHHVPRYLLACEMARGKRVLDAGAGAGYGSALLAGVAAEVTGVDIDAATVADATKTYGSATLRFAVDDCHTLANVAGPFDLIVNFENIEHLQRPADFLRRAGTLLAAGGTLLVSTPDRANTPPFKDGKPANPFHINEWYAAEFEALLRSHFHAVELRTQAESYALASRREAVESLRSALTWANPLSMLIWRKSAKSPSGRRGWKALESLAAATPADFPIVPAASAAVWGRSYCHVAICSRPIAAT